MNTSTWYALTVTYTLRGETKTISFAGPSKADAYRIKSTWVPWNGTNIISEVLTTKALTFPKE